MKRLDAVAKEVEAKRTAFAQPIAMKATMAYLDGRYVDAIRFAGQSIEQIGKLDIPQAQKDQGQLLGYSIQAAAAARAKNASQAVRSLASAQETAARNPDDAWFKSMSAFAEGMVASGNGDYRAASDALARCGIVQSALPVFERVAVADKAGDAEGAVSARRQIQAMWQRDPLYVILRKKTAM